MTIQILNVRKFFHTSTFIFTTYIHTTQNTTQHKTQHNTKHNTTHTTRSQHNDQLSW
jgi:hypothetical protein